MHCFLCCGEVVLCPGKYDFPDLFFLFYLTYQFLDLVVSDSKSGYFPAKISVREKEKKDRQGLAGGGGEARWDGMSGSATASSSASSSLTGF